MYFSDIPREVVHYLITSFFCSHQDHLVIHQEYQERYTTWKGKRDGIYQRWWSQNSHCNIVANYIQGMLHGSYEQWDEDGNLISRRNFVQNREHGIQEYWYKNKLPSERCEYFNGIRHGEHREWYNNGELKKRCRYVNGRKMGCCYYRDGVSLLDSI